MKYGLIKQIQINSIGSLTLLGCQYLVSVAIVRISGYEDAGVFSLAMSIANVFSVLAGFGVRNLQLTDSRGNYSMNQYISSRVITSLAAFFACCLYLLLVGNYTKRQSIAIVLYLIYDIVFNISDVVMGNIQLMNHLECNGVSNISRGMLCFVLFLVGERFTRNLHASLVLMDAATLGVLLGYDLIQYHKYCDNRGDFTFRSIVRGLNMLPACTSIMLAIICPVIITAIPRQQISRLLGERYLGIFSSIYTPAVILNTLIPALLMGFIPMLTDYWNQNKRKELRITVMKNYGIVFGCTIAGFIIAAVAGKLVLKILYGEVILEFFSLIYYAIAAIGLNCACICGINILIAMKRKKNMIIISMLSIAVVNLVSEKMVTSFGLYGAATAMIVTYAFQVVAQCILIIITLYKGSAD